MSAPTCPICRRRPAEPDYRPFCSKRCADLDLQRWFSGAYAVPVADDPDEAEAGSRVASGRPGDDPL